MTDPATQVRGKPKSGRTWKIVHTEKYSSNKQAKGSKRTFAQRMKDKELLKKRRAADSARKMAFDEAKKEKRLLAEARKQRREENARKSEIVVPITNMAKVKKMKKSQLRTIEKR